MLQSSSNHADEPARGELPRGELPRGELPRGELPRDELPPIDDHLVEPETPFEMYDGELVHVPPARPPHATRQATITALVAAHVRPEFEVACELLTRVSWTSEVAPDVSVFPRAPDPQTGGRQLEHLAFEVVSTESIAHASNKCSKLAARGVRRIFAIDISRERVLEWSTTLGAWSPLPLDARIVDPALAVALPVDPLLHAVRSDDEVARALLAKANPVFQAAHVRATAEGKAEGKAEALLLVLTARGIEVPGADRARILAERDPARLDCWIARATRSVDLVRILAEP